MTIFSYFIFFIVVPVCVYKFIINFNHLLVRLFTLELVSLRFFLGLALSIGVFNLEVVYLLYFLIIVVCEGVLGLCLLVLLRFCYGGDYLFIFNKLKC
jgi:hypothetical protein